jgi:uncharacterized protein YktA (UPF0223 family)
MIEETLELTTVTDYVNEIERLFENQPDKRTKEYKNWKENINSLIEKVNKLSSIKLYNKV